jgi:hypothetical protein
MRFEPLSGWREVALTERRRKQEKFAHRMLRRLVEEHYPQAEKIRIVLDNLSTHSGAAFYENTSRRRWHASWLRGLRVSATRRCMALMAVNIMVVEVEISVLVRGSASLSEDCRTWRRLSGGRRKPGVCVERNRLGASVVDWRFRTRRMRA